MRNSTKQKPIKSPLNYFCIGHLLLAMWLTLSVIYISMESPFRKKIKANKETKIKTNYSFSLVVSWRQHVPPWKNSSLLPLLRAGPHLGWTCSGSAHAAPASVSSYVCQCCLVEDTIPRCHPFTQTLPISLSCFLYSIAL